MSCPDPSSNRMSFPRRLDPDLAARVLPITVERYRAAARPFCEWCAQRGWSPWTAIEFDEALIEYKAERSPKKAAFETLVAATEFYFPRFEGSLAHSREALDGIRRQHNPHHHVPMAAHYLHYWPPTLRILGIPD